ncbi:formyltransferase family protein [Anabaenopsis elenkinii]|uniref:Methionyl-tRNA formyltransferase n=1 Tax=Anabaenopsis elenkinii CCIBt3563 TaxID=2779889 RepID=A0A7U3NLP8_9CYAN|nr:formyltransferase family protein [Anabaenopsis elenkinii]QOV21258.1 methionyl-tRNA formyltransferase [Anabaenopsis elenkinii CCIBt3563]
MNNKVTVFAMTEKGHTVLKSILPNYKNNVEIVIGSRDTQIQKDFYSEIKSLCEYHSTKFIDKKEFISINTKYALAISWRWMINTDDKVLIVFHDSLLPRYRGFNPLVSALINSEQKIGVTALLATSEYDKGDIITQSVTQIEYPIKIQAAITKILKNYQETCLYVMEKIINDDHFIVIPQDEKKATYSLWRDDEDYRINWNHSSIELKRFIDAVSYPYKGASTILNGNLVRILEAEIVKDVVIENRTPGKVIFVENDHPIVVCGEGLLKIIEMIDDQTKTSLSPVKNFRIRFL